MLGQCPGHPAVLLPGGSRRRRAKIGGVIMTDNLAKLRQCLLLLSSEHDGEVVAAARAINRQLGSSGKDWHWLAASIGGGEPADWEDGSAKPTSSAASRPSTTAPGRTSPTSMLSKITRHAAEWLFDNHGSRLRDKERDFLETMLTWSGWPTEKQAALAVQPLPQIRIQAMTS